MFGIDFEALILLALLAFILFGPEKLPEYAGKLGYYLAKLRAASTELTQQAQASFNQPLQSPSNQPALGQLNPATAAQVGVYEHSCPVCSSLVSHDFSFCPKCGARLKDEKEPPSTSESLTA